MSERIDLVNHLGEIVHTNIPKKDEKLYSDTYSHS
jgi:hypothetical protein